MNVLLSKESEFGFYLEAIDHGLLYIYDNMEIFHLMNMKYTPEQILEFEKIKGLSIEPKQFLNGILSPDSYPTEGVEFRFNFYLKPENFEEAKQAVRDQYTSMLQDKIEIIETAESDEAEYDLVIRFKDYEGITMYLKMVSLMMNGLLNKAK